MCAAHTGWIETELARLRERGRARTLESRTSAQGAEISLAGRKLINFSSNDYLGMAAHPRVLTRVHEELKHHGFGSGSAALLAGRSSLHEELERALASDLGVPRALLFSSGYMANLGALGCLVKRHSLVAHDRLNHASLIDGVTASGAQHHRYAHGDSAEAARLLQQTTREQRWLVTESLFSMDGDCAPLAQLAEHAAAAGATMYIDDAHGFGILAGGRSAAALLSPPARDAAVFMVTLGKSLGSAGAAVLGPAHVIEYLVQRSRTFIYDTAPPAVCAAAALEALAVVRETPGTPGLLLARNIARFRARAAAAGLPLAPVDGPIQPLVIGQDQPAVECAAALVDAGYYVRAVRPPTVPEGSARLRITLTASHTEAHIDGLADALGACFPR